MTPQDDGRMKALELGREIYKKALRDRRGFREDQLGIEDDDIWNEIFESMGSVALSSLHQPAPVGGDDRLNRAYTERAIASVLLAKSAIALGFKAGVGTDDNVDWEEQWRVVLYVDLPHGQISWHISPEDQHLLAGLPKYEGKWDGTFNSRSAEFALLSPPAVVNDERLREAVRDMWKIIKNGGPYSANVVYTKHAPTIAACGGG